MDIQEMELAYKALSIYLAMDEVDVRSQVEDLKYYLGRVWSKDHKVLLKDLMVHPGCCDSIIIRENGRVTAIFPDGTKNHWDTEEAFEASMDLHFRIARL